MEKGIKLSKFSEFITERRGWSEPPWLYQTFQNNLGELPIEEGIAEQVKELETRWASLEEDYWWNRYRRDFRDDHFAIDVKLRNFPDADEIRQRLGVSEDEWSDEYIDDRFWRFVSDEREYEAETLGEMYQWTTSIGFGGSGGGWLLVSPSETRGDQCSILEEDLDHYLEYKQDLKSQGEWEPIFTMITSQNWKRLNSLGMANLPADAAELTHRLDAIKSTLRQANNFITQVERDLVEMKQAAINFDKRIVDDFFEMLKDEI